MCIHGHFYQPPRENPFTGLTDPTPGLTPYSDWNERINEECYRANAAARILDESGLLLKRLSTYEWISFDFGPTLLNWLEESDPVTYRAVIEADAWSSKVFGGHGSAMAQSYNHTILPLSNSRDKRTQVRWGIADFEHRFGRRPDGMWLPETAVDSETLRILVEEGILYTVLAPHQASAVRAGEGAWVDVSGGRIDTRFAYEVEVGGERRLTVFFYNGALSHEIAFNGLLEDGRLLAEQLVAGLGEAGGEAALSNVATDGESYGHHHRFGEMALAVAIEVIRADPHVGLTNYGQFRSLHPATRLARIVDQSSWSCAHGVERWRSDCGCAPQDHPEWEQAWRAPLRDALDWLRDVAISEFNDVGPTVLRDPWAARDAYIEVILGDDEEGFLDRHCLPEVKGDSRSVALGLLEIQRRAMLMYTSCGWFFDDIARLEAVYVLRHAGRLIELTRQVLGVDHEPHFLEMLDQARSNTGVTGRDVYQAEVSPFMTSWPQADEPALPRAGS